MTIRQTMTTAFTLTLGLLWTAAPVRAQEGWEWEPDEGYHEEEWYDPSDWFDDDSTIDYEYDWDDYGYEDGTYDWGYYDYDYRDDYYDPYDYGTYDDFSYYDPYGYGSDWFDYYDPYFYDPSDYDYDYDNSDWVHLQDDDWVWSDQQNEWVRWSQMQSRMRRSGQQQNRSGMQQGSRSGSQQRNQGQGNRPQGDRSQTDQAMGNRRNQQGTQGQRQQLKRLQGTLEGYRTVDLKGQRDQHTVVRVRLQDGTERLVNFGPRNPLQRLQARQGDHIRIEGRPGQIAGRKVLMATRIESADDERTGRDARSQDQGRSQQSSTQTSVQTLRGSVDGWKRMQLGQGDRSDHLFVRLRLENGRTAVVNFGPNTEFAELGLAQGERIDVRGSARQVDGRRVLFARDVRIGGEPLRLDWSPRRQQGQQRSQPQSSSSGTSSRRI